MLLQIGNGSGGIVRDVFLRELQELVDENQWRARPLEVLHRDKHIKRGVDQQTASRKEQMPRELQTHLENLHEGQQAVLKRPLVVAMEDEWLKQLEDGEHVAEKGHVVLLPELVHVEVDATVQEASDHGQVSAEREGRSAGWTG